MIASLNGIIELKDTTFVIIDVSGVGYKVLVASSVSSKLTVGEKAHLFIHTHVKDDAIDLYGFLDLLDMKLFGYLIGVSGVGPKTVLNIFSVGSRDSIIHAIVSSNVEFFTAVPRLGKKNAQKIIIELKGKLGSTQDLNLSDTNEADSDVISALQSFGFTTREAQQALREIQADGKSTQEKIKLALKYLGK